DDPGRMPEDRRILLKVNADTAKKDAVLADVRLISQGRSVDWDKLDVVASSHQLCGKGIVPQATATVHSRRAGSDGENLHTSPFANSGLCPRLPAQVSVNSRPPFETRDEHTGVRTSSLREADPNSPDWSEQHRDSAGPPQEKTQAFQ